MQNSFKDSVSKQFALDDVTTSFTFVHGLGHVPYRVWGELVCLTADENMNTNPGDVLDITNAKINGIACGPACYGDAQNAEIAFSTPFVGQEGNIFFAPRGGVGSVTAASWSNFGLIIYAI
jgi:hypothetical protein